jgi:hypothetical protein
MCRRRKKRLSNNTMNNNDLTLKEYVIAFAIPFGIVLGVRFIWAKFVYNDMRCAFAECRIQVNP